MAKAFPKAEIIKWDIFYIYKHIYIYIYYIPTLYINVMLIIWAIYY